MLKGLMAGVIGVMALVAQPAAAVVAGDAMPEVAVKHVKDGVLDPKAMAGKVTVINFWATWCAACKVELVEMEDLLKPYLGEKDLNLAFVSLDKDPAKAVEWMQGHLKDPGKFLDHLYVDAAFEAADKLQVDAFPMTIVVGKDGKIAHVQKGFKEGEGSTQEIVKVSTQLLKVAH